MKKKIKVMCIMLVSILIVSNATACGMLKSDEELITERVDMFVFSYNKGDIDNAIECLDAKSRKIINATLNIGEGLFSGLTGFDISVEDLFALGVGFMTDDPLSMQILDIEFTSENTATVELGMTIKEVELGEEQSVDDAILYMVKEKGDWYIDMSEELSEMY